jgi:hypothetical protein
MKKVRFFSTSVAVIMATFVSVWAACTVTYPIPTLNGIIQPGQKTGETSVSCRTLTCSGSYLTSVTAIKGLIDVNQYCKPTTQCRVILYSQSGTQLKAIGSVVVPCGSSFSTSPKTITLPANTYSCQNATYCISGEVTLLNPAPSGTICGISYTSGSVTFNCTP